MKQRIIAFGLTLVVLLSSLSMISCAPPKLDDVREIYIDLIERSAEVNEILFGDGLSVYGALEYDEATKTYYNIYTTATDGKLCAVFDQTTKKYTVLRFGKEGESGELVYENKAQGIFLYATDLEFENEGEGLSATPPNGYHFVRLDERITTVNGITSLAREVYSEDYLRGVFTTLIGDGYESIEQESDFKARYYEMTVTEMTLEGDVEKRVLVRADHDVVKPIVSSVRTYDYESMRILRNSRKNFVNVEIKSYGTAVNVETGEIYVGESTIVLSFVRENGVWKLDTPTY